MPSVVRTRFLDFGCSLSLPTSSHTSSLTMDAIRKKMQSLKSETDGLYKTISGFEEATREAAARADQVRLLKI